MRTARKYETERTRLGPPQLPQGVVINVDAATYIKQSCAHLCPGRFGDGCGGQIEFAGSRIECGFMTVHGTCHNCATSVTFDSKGAEPSKLMVKPEGTPPGSRGLYAHTLRQVTAALLIGQTCTGFLLEQAVNLDKPIATSTFYDYQDVVFAAVLRAARSHVSERCRQLLESGQPMRARFV